MDIRIWMNYFLDTDIPIWMQIEIFAYGYEYKYPQRDCDFIFFTLKLRNFLRSINELFVESDDSGIFKPIKISPFKLMLTQSFNLIK